MAPEMTRRLFQFSVALALIAAVGGHWTVLQSVAWVGMAVNYSQDASLAVALKKTFDGDHPCRLCVAVKHGKQEEKKRDVFKVETRLDLVCLAPVAYLHPALPFTLLSPPSHSALARGEAPPTPPPRIA
jgi:hypothetical protein